MSRWLAILLATVAAILAVIWHRPILRWWSPPASAPASSTGIPAGHAAAGLGAGPFTLRLASGSAALPVGDSELTVSVRDDHGPVRSATLTLDAATPAVGSRPAMQQDTTLSDVGGGDYRGTLRLPVSGTWTLRIAVHTADGRAGEAMEHVTTGQPLPSPALTGAGIDYYTCSMHPSVRSAAPGSCPICGMDLVPVTHAERTSGEIVVDASRRQLIGVTTAPVTAKATVLRLRAAGQIVAEAPRMRDVTLRHAGWIGELQANVLGMSVKAGDPVFTVYSPELLTAQADFLQALRSMTREPDLVTAARERLEAWGLTPAQIDALGRRGAAQTYVPILAPCTGVIIAKDVVAGSTVDIGKPVLRIADLSEVWVEAAVYQEEEAQVQVGMPVAIELSAFPGRSWRGTIDFIAPVLDPITRTVQVRLTLRNADLTLKPGMYVTAHIEIPLGTRLLVPTDAVIRAGDTAVVFVDLGDGRLKPQHVTVGLETADGLEILSGLHAGEVVVTRSLFLLAAESRLKSGADAW